MSLWGLRNEITDIEFLMENWSVRARDTQSQMHLTRSCVSVFHTPEIRLLFVGKEIVMILALAYTGLIEDYRLKILSGDDMAGCRDLA